MPEDRCNLWSLSSTSSQCPDSRDEFSFRLAEIAGSTTHHGVLLPVQRWILSKGIQPIAKQDPQLPVRYEIDREEGQ